MPEPWYEKAPIEDDIEAAFEGVVADARREVAGTARSDRDVRVLVVTTMEDSGAVKARRGLFTNWYARVKKELGVR